MQRTWGESAEGMLGRVGAHIASQCGPLGEAVVAQVAAEGALARVDAQVGVQVDLLLESLPPWLHWCVHSPVCLRW